MSLLSAIAGTAQQVAEAISAVLDVETQILDDEYTIVAATGKYKELVGTKDAEAYHPNEEFLYTRVFRTGMSFVIDDPRDSMYGPILIGEVGEICCPIKLNEKVIGAMSLVAFDKNQQDRLQEKKEQLKNFLHRMAFLLASRVSETEAYKKLEFNSHKMRIIVESINQGLFSVDRSGIITHCNSYAESITGMGKKYLLGRRITDIWPKSPVPEVLASGRGYEEKEEIHGAPPHQLHLLVTATPISGGGATVGAVISFRSMSAVRQLAYDLTDTKVALELDHIVGNSRVIAEVKYQALRVARGNSTILITGESGTGKELFARAIHYASPRCKKPLVIVNCGAIPETLLESELFGYEEGAFTGASRGGRPGKFELACGGTIFLDEIGDLPLHLQVKILHILQRRIIERVGGNTSIPVDVRVIAATNRNLEAMCAAGEFREDLYYRLNVIPMSIPPLRKRREDVIILMEYFLRKYRGLLDKNIERFSDNVVQAFTRYRWPGNVRELENAVEYAVNMESGKVISLNSVPGKIRNHWLGHRPEDMRLKHRLEDAERDLLAQKITELAGHNLSKKEIARLMGISRATLYRKIKQYDIK